MPARSDPLLEQRFAEDPDLAILRQELADAFDLRNVVQTQQDGDHRPANYRVSQLFKRMAPHLSVDGDTYPYTEANEEHIRVVATPSALEEEVNAAFRQAMRGYDDFEWVPNGDANRIDACHIVHGLPLVQLRSMPDLYRHYAGGEFRPADASCAGRLGGFPRGVFLPPHVLRELGTGTAFPGGGRLEADRSPDA